MKRNFYILLICSIMSISALSGCSSQSTLNIAESDDSSSLSATHIKSWTFDEEDYYKEEVADTVISFNIAEAEINGSGAEFSDGNIIISSEGIYELTGSFDGSVIIEANENDNVKLILNNVEITSLDGPAIYAEKCGKLIISSAQNSQNTLSDSDEYTLDNTEDEPDSVLFSKSDLTINGLGVINISGAYKNGIKCKDNLVITGGDINVISADNAFVGRDILAVTDANINVECGGDALKTTNSDESDMGELYIEGGTIIVDCEGDGIDSANAVYFNDGSLTVKTGEGAESVSKKYTNEFKREDSFDMDTQTEDTGTSQKGIKAENVVSVSGGTIVTDTIDDSIHSNDSVYISSGSLTISSGDDGVHADNNLEINGGTINIVTCYEGLEGFTIDISEGDISIYAEDDGINAAGTSSDDELNENTEGESEPTSESSKEKIHMSQGTTGCNIMVSGGYIFVDADGDGIDSNDTISITGGTIIVSGPTNNGNGSMDYESSMLYDGGTLIYSGSSGMLQTPDTNSSTYSITMLFTDTQESGKGVVLTTSDGEIVAAVAPSKEYAAITIGSEKIQSGKEYKIIYGAELTGESKNGIYNSYEINSSGGEVSFSVSDSVTYVDKDGITDKTSAGGMNKGGLPMNEDNKGRAPDSDKMTNEPPNDASQEENNPNASGIPSNGGQPPKDMPNGNEEGVGGSVQQ